MTPDEKIQELAHIVAELIDTVKYLAPHNCKAYLNSLQERAEELAEES